ncbi:cupin [Halobacteriales archaeon QH_2_65_14]|nr:MAG: cupin [Halobacteriales archaeon QH_2_65_14]
MSYTAENYEDVEQLAPGMHFMRNALDCDNLGVTVIEADAGWEGKEHDHADEGEEEVYVLLDGSGRMTIEDEEVSLDAGDAVRVDPDASRRLAFDEESTMVIAGAP